MSGVRPLVMVAVVVVLGAVVVIVAGGRFPWSGHSADECDIPASVTGGTAGSSASAPDGGGVRVVEKGFNQGERGSVSLGAMLENTSRVAAYRTRVTFQLFDGARARLPETSLLAVEIPVILPGQRVGAGAGITQANVVSFEVDTGTTTWVPREALGDFAPVTATYLQTIRFNPKTPLNIDIRYRETSQNCRSLRDQQTATIFRDANGAIVGGSHDHPGSLYMFRDENGRDLGGEWQLPESSSCSTGARDIWVIPLTPTPSTAADSRTEIYPYCDLS
jgi:hypothetical protein